MTLKIPQKSFGDSILDFFGKKRALYLPVNYLDINIDIYAIAVKENFWRALFRPRNRNLPHDAIEYKSPSRIFEE